MRRWLCLCVLFLMCACSSGGSGYQQVTGRGLPKAQPDRDPVRRIVMLHPYFKEKIDVVFFRDGHYESSALRKIEKIMRDRHNGFVGDIDPELIDYMVDIRKRLGLPASVPFQILSGYRSPETNAKLAENNANVARESTHMRGWGVDFRIDGVNSNAICEIAKTMQRGGAASYPGDNHVHVDIGDIRTWNEKRK